MFVSSSAIEFKTNLVGLLEVLINIPEANRQDVLVLMKYKFRHKRTSHLDRTTAGFDGPNIFLSFFL